MQYLLSEDEYRKLLTDAERGRKILCDEELQTLCTKIADELPIEGWHAKTGEKSPWGCVITANKKQHEWHCDDCPVQDICPYPHKDWSK